ncbi:MAG: DUF418 domain-containing protein [Caldimonas sp.]
MNSEPVTLPARNAAPVPPFERIAALDVLRGIALLGIFIMNMPGFTHSLFTPPVVEPAIADRAVAAVRDALFAGKFNLLFGFVFGIGFTLQITRLGGDGAGRGAVAVYCRRLAVLLAIGLIHAALLWPGDVLVVYAVLGFALLAIRRWPDWALLGLVAACLVYPAAADGFRPLLLSFETETLAAFQYQDFETSNDLAFGHGSFADVVVESARVFLWSYGSPLGLFSYAAFYVQMATGIVTGLLVGRRGWVQRLAPLQPQVRRLQWLALGFVAVAAGVGWGAVGLGAGAAQPGQGAAGSALDFVAGFSKTIGRAALAAFYALSVARLAGVHAASPWLAPFARAGRMPLSNYLLQTLMASFLFYGWGLGWWGRAGPATETLLAIALFFTVQLPLSSAWLARFRQGPVEWAWRRLTYRRAAA